MKKSKENHKVSVTSLVAWGVGGVVSFISLQTGMLIPPLVGIISAGLTYVVLEKLLNKNVSVLAPKMEEEAI